MPLSGFVSRVLVAPVGVSMLAALEASVRDDVSFPFRPDDASLAAIVRAVDVVASMDGGDFLAMVLDAANRIAGPWNPEAPRLLANAYRLAKERLSIAEAVAARFGSLLSWSALGSQEWWTSDLGLKRPRARTFDLSQVYGNGEFPWQGVRTVTDPPAAIHDDLVDAWEMHPGPISRWRLPYKTGARVFIVDQPADWARLVTTYGLPVRAKHQGWELPGPNQSAKELNLLVTASDGHAARTRIDGHALPDWEAVAADYDAVTLTWAGFISTEGLVDDLADGAVTMLRYWGSERTLWLRDMFGEPLPLPAPHLSGRSSGCVGIDVTSSALRHAQDQRALNAVLGRRAR